MLKNVLYKFGIIFGLVIASSGGDIGEVLGKRAFASEKPTKQEIESTLVEAYKEAAKQINAGVPRLIDSETRLDKASVGPGPKVVYHHTFINYSSKKLTAEKLQKSLRPEVTGKVCSSADMKASLQYGGSYVYSYSGNDGAEIVRFEIDRKTCGFPSLVP